MADLPPDLARLGDELARAARRANARRELRRRMAVAAAVGATVFAALTPAALGPALRDIDAAGRLAAPGCDQPRGTRFTIAACEDPMILKRPAPWPTYS